MSSSWLFCRGRRAETSWFLELGGRVRSADVEYGNV